MNKYYVYALLDERKPGYYEYEIDDIIIEFNYEPFYIGKGTGNRIAIHEKSATFESNTNIKDNKIRKIWSEGKKVVRTKVLDHLEDNVAFDLEIKLIKIIGRRESGGPLINLTDGGDGLKNPSPEVRAKISEGSKNRIISEETREKLRNSWYNKLSRLEKIKFSRGITLEEAQVINHEISMKVGSYRKGTKHSEETKRAMSLRQKGVPKPPRTDEHKKNLSASMIGKFAGEFNPMYQKNFRDNRIKKFGEIKEQELENERIDKINKTTNQKKLEAEALFPGTPYNVYMQAYNLYNKGTSLEDSLRIATENNEKNNRIAKENKIKKDVANFYSKLKNGTLNPYKKELYDVSLFLLELRKQKGVRDSLDEVKDLNLYLSKKFRKDKISELEQMINFYGVCIEENR
jgi:hypothetical protein